MHITYSNLSTAFTCILLTLVFLVLALAFPLLLHSECVCGLEDSAYYLLESFYCFHMYFAYSSVSNTYPLAFLLLSDSECVLPTLVFLILTLAFLLPFT